MPDFSRVDEREKISLEPGADTRAAMPTTAIGTISQPTRTFAAVTTLAACLAIACTPALRQPIAIERRTAFATAGDGTQIYYEVAGAGPAVVLIHGLGGNHAVWFQQVPALARNHTVVTISQRGFAPSQGSGDRYDVEVLVADLVAVMDAAGISRAHVVGQSMGGWTALGVALRYPERVASVVLADTVAGISDPVIAEHHKTMAARAREISTNPLPLGTHPALDPEFCARHPDQAYLYQMLASFGAPAPGQIAGQLAAASFDPASLAANQVPVRFIVGERDPVFPVPIIERAAGLLANSRVAVIPDSGHSPYFEKPDAWNELVAEFWRKNEQAPITRRARTKAPPPR